MLRLLIPTGSGYTWVEHAPPAPFPDEFLWADLFEPTQEEEKAVESLLTVDVPTRDEMKEIETSNRLYEENGAVYMTATVGSKLDTPTPESSAITFILANNRLITNRYADPTPVRRFMGHVERSPAACTSSATLLAGLLEAFTERIADLLERVQAELDSVSLTIFPRTNGTSASNRDLHAMIQKIGMNGDLISKARESLVSFQRLLMYVQQATNVTLSRTSAGVSSRRCATCSRCRTMPASSAARSSSCSTRCSA
jgi:magnesium transporter